MTAPVQTERAIRIPKPLRHQLPLYRSRSKRKLARAGRRGGKTQISLNCIVLGHGSDASLKGMAQGGKMLWLAKDYPQAATIWDRQIVPRFKGVHGVIVNEQKKMVQLPSCGGELLIRSAESIDNVRGLSFDGVVIDEGAFIKLKYALNSVLLPALADRDGWALVISSPKLGSDLNELCGENLEHMNADTVPVGAWAQFHWSTRDNPALPAHAVEALYSSYPSGSTDLAEELDAELLTQHGALFSREQFVDYRAADQFSVTFADGTSEPVQDVMIYCDLALSLKEGADYTVFLVAGILPPAAPGQPKRAAILDIVRDRMEAPEQLKRIEALALKWRPTAIKVESVAFQASVVQHLRKAVHICHIQEVRPDKDKRSRAVAASAAMAAGRILWPSSHPLKHACMMEAIAFPTGKHDDCVDTLSYLAADLLKTTGSAAFWVAG